MTQNCSAFWGWASWKSPGKSCPSSGPVGHWSTNCPTGQFFVRQNGQFRYLKFIEICYQIAMACWNGRPMGKMCFMSWRPKQNRSPAMFSSRFSRPPSLTIHLNVCWFISGWWLTYPSEKKKNRQLGLLYPIHGKIRFMFQTTNQIYPNMLKPPKIWSILIQFMTEPSRWPWRVVTPKLWVYIYIYYPLVMTNSLLLKMAIEIVIFTMTNGDFSIVMLVYQRVDCIVSCLF